MLARAMLLSNWEGERMEEYRNQLLPMRAEIPANHINSDAMLCDSVFGTETQISSADSNSSPTNSRPQGPESP